MPTQLNKPPLATRLSKIKPFYVMAMLDQAKQLESQGKRIVHMEVGEPDFVTAEPIMQAAQNALKNGQVHYTAATGLPALRESIAHHYQERYQINITRSQVIVTSGASGALSVALTAILNPGDEVLIADPGYPCNKNFVRILAANPVEIPVGREQNFQLNVDLLAEHWTEKSKVVMLASPSNPTGTTISRSELEKIADWVADHNAWLIVDEIYHGLVYGVTQMSAVGLNDHTIVINSFSKYYGMTGWRLGWIVASEAIITHLDVLSQNMFLAAPTIAQYAAIAAFTPPAQEIMDQRRAIFQQRRDYLYAELMRLGFTMYDKPDGAFYIYVGCEKFSEDSMTFCQSLLAQAGVATAPGIDFGQYKAAQHLRFAYTTSSSDLEFGIAQMQQFLAK